ncbi:MAG: GDYXXLXY domain-containing protein [Alphaproteobacteria bacterium]|nr:GDYXXLXY domain-containing protein [Alphaproteobacteria bacterium]
MKIPAPQRILAVAGLCAAALVALVVTEGFAREGGQEITLPMEAVDPRALLSGHYVQLNFTNRLEANDVCPSNSAGEWVALRPENNIYVAAGSADSRDHAERLGPLPVKGTFTCSAPTPSQDGLEAMPGWLALDLGVDRFHINQADALRIEQVLREQRPNEETRAFAVLSVGRDGRARLRALVIDGERFDLRWL